MVETSYTFEGWLGHDANAVDGGMQWGAFEPKKWDENDVDIKVTHCGIVCLHFERTHVTDKAWLGICGSDLHTVTFNIRIDLGAS